MKVLATIIAIVTVLLCVLRHDVAAEDVVRVSPRGGACDSYVANAVGVAPSNSSIPVITRSLKNWEGIVLLASFGLAGLLVGLIHRLVRTYVYFDAHLLDTFFDAGGDVSVGLVASSVVAKWTWTSSFTWSAYYVIKYGAVGQFWSAAGLVIQLFLFSILACEIRIKAPGAKTFLQMIHARFGAPTHVILMIFALFVNLLIASMVVYEGSNIFFSLVQDVKKEIFTLIFAVCVAVFAVVGGVGGSFYFSYLGAVLIITFMLVYLVEIMFDPFNRQVEPLGAWEQLYSVVECYKANGATSGSQLEAENMDDSSLTFLSRGGMIEGVIMLLASFSSVFMNQSFWQTAISAKPTQTVWGILTGGLVWFAIPFGFSFALGTAYQVWSVTEGAYPTTDALTLEGLLPVYISQRLLGIIGDYLMVSLTAMVVMTTAAGEVLSASSIVVYDIYMTYISPFKSVTTNSRTIPEYTEMTRRSRRALQTEEHTQYDKRCLMLKHVVVIVLSLLLIPSSIALFYLNVPLPYLAAFLGVVAGSCVIPVALSITWHRVTGLGVSLGVFGGIIAGAVAWLVYATQFPGALEKFYVNTARWQPLLVGTAAALGVGGIVAVMFSLCCGGCDSDRVEEEEWERTRAVDSALLPWAVKYAPEFKSLKRKGIPHFLAVRRTFKCAEVSAYIMGVLLAVGVVLVWPACMLLLDDWSQTVYEAWTLLTLIWACVAAAVICLLPLVLEIHQVCRQAYYNRKWTSESQTDLRPLDDEVSHQERAPQDVQSIKTVESDFQSTMGRDSGLDDTSRKERWKTFIHLD